MKKILKDKIISATTFQLTPLRKGSFSFAIGNRVESPVGKGVIVELDKVTGNCKVKLDKAV